MTDRGEHTKCQFLKTDDYLVIDSKYYGSDDDIYSSHSIFIKNEEIFWLYKNMNELLNPDLIERKFRETSSNKEEFLDIEFKGGLDRCTTVMIDITSKNNKGFGWMMLPFNERDPFNKDDSLYPFLIELEKYVPEELKKTITQIWKQDTYVTFERKI